MLRGIVWIFYMKKRCEFLKNWLYARREVCIYSAEKEKFQI